MRSVIDERRKRGIRAGRGRRDARSSGPSDPAMARCKLDRALLGRRPPARCRSPGATGGAMIVPDFVPDKVFDEHFIVASSARQGLRHVRRRQAGRRLSSRRITDRRRQRRTMSRARSASSSAQFRRIFAAPRGSSAIPQRCPAGSSASATISAAAPPPKAKSAIVWCRSTTEPATRVELSIGYSLRGMLAQIAREGLVRDLAARLTADFARNLELHISGAQPGPAQQEKSLDGFALMFGQLRILAREIARRIWKR